MPANHALYARPLRIHGGGVIVSGTDWERFSFANPGASVAEFLRWFDGSLVKYLDSWMPDFVLDLIHPLRWL